MNLLREKMRLLPLGTPQLGGGGGGGGPTQTTSTVQNTNIPSYAQPYVESMLGATQKQLFNTSQVQTGTDDQGNPIMGTELTGFKPYQAYGGTYDAQGNQLSYDPSKAVAGFSPMQQAAQRGIGNMAFDPGRYNMAQLGAEAAGRGGLSSAQDAMRYGQAGQAAGYQGQTAGLQGQTLGILGGQAAISNAGRYGDMGVAAGQAGQALGLSAAADAQALAREQAGRANKFGDAGFASGQMGQQLGIAGGAKYGEMGAGYGQQAANLAGTALGYGQESSDIGKMGLRAEQYGRQVSSQAQDYARQAAGAGAQYAQMATDPRVTRALMSPYMQNVLDVQNEELNRQAGVAAQNRGAAAVRAGAFGGGRQAIENAEAERNLATIKNANAAQAYQQAFQNAQAQQQFGANLNLQGLAGAQQGLGTALQGGQLGLSGIGTALQGQQGALAGVGAANQAYQTGIQGAGMGLQGVDRQLAGTAQGMQGAQVGLAGVGAATNAGQLGLQGAQVGLQGTAQGMQGAQVGLSGIDRALAGTQAQLAGTAQGMQGAGMAMQGAGMGLQGVQGAQAGYGLTNQSASNLTNILGQQQQNQLGLYGAQNAAGAQQQALEQAKVNQAMLDYANAQQYPLMQLGTMSNMLRGLPMQASTTNQYAASPNPLSQAVGTIGAGASIYNAMAPRGATGGVPSEFKYAKGGITSVPRYDMGGEVESQLENMDEKGLQAQARESSSPSIRKMAQRLLRERQMSKQPQSPDAANVQYQAAQPQMPSYKPGGIVAFTAGGGANEEGGEEEARIGMQERLAQAAPTTGGIMGATTPPTTPVPYAPTAGRAVQQAALPEFIKAQYADAERRQGQSLADIMAEKKAAYAAEGVADAAAGQQEQRAGLMAEKANLTAENERQRNLRMASFFAKWGSTPGPVLVAGMNALKESIPDIISDDKEQKKVRRDIDKSIADLDNATRLEKRGEVDNAMAIKLKAAEDMKSLQGKLIEYQTHKETNERALEASKYTADMHFKSEQLRSQTAHLDRVANRETQDDNKRFNAYSVAAQNEMRVINKITDQASGGQYKKDLDDIKTARMTATDEKGNFDPAKVPAPLRPAMEAAEARVAAQQEVWNKQKEQAARDTELAYKRVRVRPEEAAKDYTKPTGGAQAGASTRPPLTDPSLQR
jgi:hypothetical protein